MINKPGKVRDEATVRVREVCGTTTLGERDGYGDTGDELRDQLLFEA